jgi:hypothetical protein
MCTIAQNHPLRHRSSTEQAATFRACPRALYKVCFGEDLIKGKRLLPPSGPLAQLRYRARW